MKFRFYNSKDIKNIKKRILNFILILSCFFTLSGCGNDIVHRTNNQLTQNKSNTNRFVATKDEFKINIIDYTIVYDSKTSNVYISGITIPALTPLYNANKKIMIFDEYTKNRITTSERFVPIDDSYNMDTCIGSLSYKVFYDSLTHIVYIVSGGGTPSITPFYGTDNLPMTLEEYNDNK